MCERQRGQERRRRIDDPVAVAVGIPVERGDSRPHRLEQRAVEQCQLLALAGCRRLPRAAVAGKAVDREARDAAHHCEHVGDRLRRAPRPSTSPSSSASTTPSASPTAAAPSKCSGSPFPASLKTQLVSTYKIAAKNPSINSVLPNAETCPSTAVPSRQCRAYTSLPTTEQTGVLTALSNLDCGSTQPEPDVPTNAYYACDDGKTYGAKIAYLLGPVIVQGTQIDTASAQAPSGQNGQVEWTVALTLGASGADRWSAWTSKYNTTSNATVIAGQSGVCAAASAVPCSDFVGFTLDGQVISAPITQAALSDEHPDLRQLHARHRAQHSPRS